MIELGNRQVFMIATCRIDGEQDIRGLLCACEQDIITTLLRASRRRRQPKLLEMHCKDAAMPESAPVRFFFAQRETRLY